MSSAQTIFTKHNQNATYIPNNPLDPAKLAVYGAPRYTTTYAISQLAYNLSLGAAIVHVLIWNWRELREAFGGMKWLRRGVDQDIQDPHFESTSFSFALNEEVMGADGLW